MRKKQKNQEKDKKECYLIIKYKKLRKNYINISVSVGIELHKLENLSYFEDFY